MYYLATEPINNMRPGITVQMVTQKKHRQELGELRYQICRPLCTQQNSKTGSGEEMCPAKCQQQKLLQQ